MKITMTKPSREMLDQSVLDILHAYQNELHNAVRRASEFLNSDCKGKRTFRTKPLKITIEK